MWELKLHDYKCYNFCEILVIQENLSRLQESRIKNKVELAEEYR